MFIRAAKSTCIKPLFPLDCVLTKRKNMSEIWKRMKTWLNANAPHILDDLNPPADEKAFTAIEKHLGVEFPIWRAL